MNAWFWTQWDWIPVRSSRDPKLSVYWPARLGTASCSSEAGEVGEAVGSAVITTV